MTTPANAAIEPRKVDAGRGGSWLAEAFEMFRQASAIWIGMAVLYMVIVVGTALVPGAALLLNLFGPVFSGGFILACASQDAGQGVRIEHLFAGFKGNQFGQLVLLAVIYFAAIIVIMIIGLLIALLGFGLSPSHFSSKGVPAAHILPILLTFLIFVALLILAGMGMWLAPALVVLRKLAPVEAFKLSFKACIVNWVPLLVYGLATLSVAIAATFPLLLGWAASAPTSYFVVLGLILVALLLLVATPVLFISVYTAYRDMFPMPPPQPDFNATQPLPVPPPL